MEEELKNIVKYSMEGKAALATEGIQKAIYSKVPEVLNARKEEIRKTITLGDYE